MRTLRLLLVAALLLFVAAPAAHAGTTAIINDCYEDGDLDGDYSPSEIRDARNNIPTDVDQYSDCRDVLNRALGGSGSRAVGGGGAGGSGPGATAGGAGGGAGGAPLTPATPEEQQALDTAAGAPAPVTVGDQQIVPGASGFAAGAARNELPPALLAALIALGLAAAAALALPVRRVVARRLG